MEVRSRRYPLSGRIALGNSNNGLVEGYATIQEVIKIPFSEISKYENQHRATEWLKTHYTERDFLWGFVLRGIVRKKKPFPYLKDSRMWFVLE